MNLLVTLLREILRTVSALEGLYVLVDQQMVFQSAFPGKFLPATLVLTE